MHLICATPWPGLQMPWGLEPPGRPPAALLRPLLPAGVLVGGWGERLHVDLHGVGSVLVLVIRHRRRRYGPTPRSHRSDRSHR